MSFRLKWYGIVCISTCALAIGSVFQNKDSLAIVAAGILISATIAFVGGEGR
jgi:nitric oxide synthase oxygenase domain/subunit